jgi:hypothetical protein
VGGAFSGHGGDGTDITTPFSQPQEPPLPQQSDAEGEAKRGTPRVVEQEDEDGVKVQPQLKRKQLEGKAAAPTTKKRKKRKGTPHTKATKRRNDEADEENEASDAAGAIVGVGADPAGAVEDDIEVDEELESMLKRDDEEAEAAEKRRNSERDDWPWPSTLLDPSQLTPFTYSSQPADVNAPSSASPPPPQPPPDQRRAVHEEEEAEDEDEAEADKSLEEGEEGRRESLGLTPSFHSLFAGLSPSPELGSSDEEGEDDDSDVVE